MVGLVKIQKDFLLNDVLVALTTGVWCEYPLLHKLFAIEPKKGVNDNYKLHYCNMGVKKVSLRRKIS